MALARQVPMISIPIKATDDVDLAAPLRQFIRANYGSPDKYTEEYTVLYRMRQDMRNASKDEVGRDLLYRYYGQLELLELRFPIDEDHIRISFNWYDAFTEVPIAQHSLAYEKACVLFNIAATLSHTASTQTRSEIAGMKKAYHSLQACAGLLNYINDNFLHAPSTDLSREGIKSLAHVMLAQAQEVFTEKQISDSGKASIIAKLAAETANLYHNASDSITELVIAGNIDAAWSAYVQIKEKYFSSIAQFYQATFDAEKSKHGSAVARLQAGVHLAKEAMTLAKTNAGQFGRYPYLSNDPGIAFVEVMKSHFEITTDKLNTAKKENDMIYHEPILKEANLPAIVKLAAAKPIPLAELYAGQDVARIIGPDVFRKLIPLQVHESASLYSEEIAKLLRAEQERSDIADSKLTSGLDFLDLPRSLQQLRRADEHVTHDLARPPVNLETLVSQTIAREVTGPIPTKMTSIESLRRRIEEALRKTQQQLEEERLQCDSMMARYRSQWTQQPSSQLTSGFYSDLSNFQASLDSATKSDRQMQSEFESVKVELAEISDRSPGHLDVIFHDIVAHANLEAKPDSASLLDLGDDTGTEDVAIKVDQVEDLMRKLNLVKKERLQTLQDLKEKARKDDISEVLMFNRKTPDLEQRVFASELEKFKPHQVRISATISRQEQLLEEMTRIFSTILNDKDIQTKQRKYDALQRTRASKIAKLEKAASVHADLYSGLTRAAQFYTELEALTSNLTMNVKQYLKHRQAEGRQLLDTLSGQASLHQQFQGMSFNDGMTRR